MTGAQPEAKKGSHAGAEASGLPLTAALVFLIALALRLIYLWQIRSIGFFNQPVSDGLIFVHRAAGIAAGGWLGPADFVHAPLYAYVLAAVRVFAGDGLWWPRVVQALFGATSCVVLMVTCQRFFDRKAAMIAGVLLAVFPPAIFFDGLIQKTSLALLLSTLLLLMLALCRDRRAWWIWLLSGLVFGLLSLTRQNALVLVFLVVAWWWTCGCGERPRRRVVWLLSFAVGLLVTLTPWAMRNKTVTGELVLTTPNMGQNFAMGNHPDATGTYLPFQRGRSTAEHEQQAWVEAAEKATGRSMSPREVSDYYFRSALDYITANPGPWFALTFKKILITWGAYEAYDTEDYYLYQEWSWLLRVFDKVFHFGVLCPLAVLGVALTWRRWRELWLLYGWLVLTTLAVAAFVVFARYRFPLVPVLIMFAAACLVEAVASIRRGAWRGLIAGAVAALIVAPIVNWPWLSERKPCPNSYTNHGMALAAQGRYEEDLAEIAKALALDPNNIDAHLAAGNTLLLLDRPAEALAHYERARDGDPQYGGAYRGVGRALTALGRWDEAARQFQAALTLDNEDHLALTGLATATARQGRLAEAIELFHRALAIDPTYADAHLNLGNTYLAMGRVDDAVACYEAAIKHRPDYADAWFNLGAVEAQRGNLPRARSYFERVLNINPRQEEAKAALQALGADD
ncbi:MAG: tetratricopeptide repeat protein [Phycisphaerales bacterium]|nr:MAG: tetratricopeptide repeat protein [Phycisphaerales bacterium]